MRLIWGVLKLIVEPSGAVTLAAILEGKIDVRGRRVGRILSGGNLDLDRLPWVNQAPRQFLIDNETRESARQAPR